MNIDGIYMFKGDSGIPLYSRKTVHVEEDLFSAFLSALKGFFQSFSLGGLSSFSSENFIFYLASANNVLTAIIVDNKFKSDKYFNLAYKICSEYYKNFKDIVDSSSSIISPSKSQFDPILDEIIDSFESDSEEQKELIKLFKVLKAGDLEEFNFESEESLFNLPLFIAINYVTKQIFVIENSEEGVSSRLLFLANKSVTNLNQKELKSEFSVRNVSDPWDLERVVQIISKLLVGESFPVLK